MREKTELAEIIKKSLENLGMSPYDFEEKYKLNSSKVINHLNGIYPPEDYEVLIYSQAFSIDKENLLNLVKEERKSFYAQKNEMIELAEKIQDEGKKTFSQVIKLYRKKFNLNQDHIASQMDVNRASISFWESGRNIELNRVEKLAEILGIDKRYLLKLFHLSKSEAPSSAVARMAFVQRHDTVPSQSLKPQITITLPEKSPVGQRDERKSVPVNMTDMDIKSAIERAYVHIDALTNKGDLTQYEFAIREARLLVMRLEQERERIKELSVKNSTEVVKK